MVADAAGYDAGTQAEAALVEHRAGRGQVVAEAVQHPVAGADAGGPQGRSPAPRVRSGQLRLIDRTG
ncbi:MAG: hypothetical protein IPI32_13895 [Austwickia sp.]|nr:hypothetical protein [Austwickia sp.]